MKTSIVITMLSACLFLTACNQDQSDQASIDAVALPDNAMGYFCGMNVKMHKGPKGQIFLKDQAEPIWFVSVQDTLAFTRMPDEAHRVKAVFVSDMDKAESWDDPGDKAWMRADIAWFVVESSAKGGMGGAEMVPFGSEEAAAYYASNMGGRVVVLDEIPTSLLLGSGIESMDGSEEEPADKMDEHHDQS